MQHYLARKWISYGAVSGRELSPLPGTSVSKLLKLRKYFFYLPKHFPRGRVVNV